MWLVEKLPERLKAPIRGVTQRLVGWPKEPQVQREYQTVRGGPLAGLSLFVPKPPFAPQRLLSGETEPAAIRVAQASVKAGDVVYDIGGHIGIYAIVFGRGTSPGGVVHVFEPLPANAHQLQEHVRRNAPGANVVIHSCALSDANGETVLHWSDRADSMGYIDGAVVLKSAPAKGLYSSFETLRVPTYSLDSYVEEKRLPSPALIKIDVEGAELLVLRGSERLLRNVKPALIIEVHTAQNAVLVGALLADWGYELEVIESPTGERSEVLAKPRGSTGQ